MPINKPCSNSLLHSLPNATQHTNLRSQQCSHQLHNFLFLILPRSIQQEGEQDRRGGQGRGGRANFGSNTGGRNARTPFANFVGRGGQGGLLPISGGGGHGGGVLPFAQLTMPRNTAPMYSNIIKTYSNWNVCFCVDLTSRTDIHRRHAPPLGDVQITKKV